MEIIRKQFSWKAMFFFRNRPWDKFEITKESCLTRFQKFFKNKVASEDNFSGYGPLNFKKWAPSWMFYREFFESIISQNTFERLYPFQPSVVFYLETSQLFCSANQCNSRLKWVKEGNKEGHINSSAQKKRNFPLRIDSVNVIKSARNCGFGHIY